ncbi:MAG: phosphotransferase, partial [Anaerolineales bacterium]|nr:phosphotransferase [Anaerolineales bacterium]
MESSEVQRAIRVVQSAAFHLGLHTTAAAVLHNSDRIAVRLLPGDVLVRIAPHTWEADFQFEVEVACALAETDCPIGELEPRVEPRAYVRDAFAFTFWKYYEHTGDVMPTAYADALMRMHAGLRQIRLAAPHITERISAWAEEVNTHEQTPDLSNSDREMLRSTFRDVQNKLSHHRTSDQLLHGEPHPGNLLNTHSGPLFIDLQTCQYGPIEYDIAFMPEEAAEHYLGANYQLVQLFRTVNWAGFTTMRWRSSDQFPNRAYWRAEGF